jgi:hypothetical protein
MAKKNTTDNLTADDFLETLALINTSADNKKFFKGNDKDNLVFNIRMSDIFTTAKLFMQMPLAEIKRLVSAQNNMNK